MGGAYTRPQKDPLLTPRLGRRACSRQVPKMLWVKQQMPRAFERVSSGGKFLDLADFLSYRATDRAIVDIRLCKYP